MQATASDYFWFKLLFHCKNPANMTVAGGIFFGVLFLLHAALGQIPADCVTQENLMARKCCPIYDDMECGGALRGMCDNIHENNIYKTDYVPPNGSSASDAYNDTRFNWPTRFFDSICVCTENHAGYHCGECRFGYAGENCETKLDVKIRKSAASMSDSEWETYNTYLNKSKNLPSSRYMVYTGGDVASVNNYQSVTLYNLAVWMHHYASRTNQQMLVDQSAYNYAHGSLGFLTWHRLYLLWFEREMQILNKDNSFSIPYWNWLEQSDRTALFVPNKLGSNDDGTVVSEYYGYWKPVCLYDPMGLTIREVCNPENSSDFTQLTRCTEPNQCMENNSKWPNAEKTLQAIERLSEYRISSSEQEEIYNKKNINSFSNYLEGWDTDHTVSNLCTEPLDDDNEVFCGINMNDGIPRRLHNTVHILLNGTMLNIPGSPNDPIFLNHHATIDCLFQIWMEKHPTAAYPNHVLLPKFAGHGLHDGIVPFLPLYTNQKMFQNSEEVFGYKCDLTLSQPTTAPPTNPPATRPPSNNPPPAGNPNSAVRDDATGVLMALSVVLVCLVTLLT